MDTKATKQTEALTVVKVNKVGEFDHEVVFELPNGETASYTSGFRFLRSPVLPIETVYIRGRVSRFPLYCRNLPAEECIKKSP
jgi:hypothetical protein